MIVGVLRDFLEGNGFARSRDLNKERDGMGGGLGKDVFVRVTLLWEG